MAELLVDDFSSGETLVSLNGSVPQIKRAYQAGSMLGGVRAVHFNQVTNEYGLTGSFAVRKKAFISSQPFHTNHRFEILYGYDRKGNPNPFSLDVSGFQTLRVSFEGMNGGLNLNAQLLSGTVFRRILAGTNMGESAESFTVDFDLRRGSSVQNPLDPNQVDDGSDLKNIGAILVIVQSAGVIPANDYAIKRISFV
jgi:hypothetical protein